MKTMITKFAAAALMLAAVACQREELEGGKTPGAPSENLVPMTITASLESDDDAQARTALQSDGKVHWESGDTLTVMAVDEAGNLSASYEFTTEGSGAKADFSGLVGEETAGLSAGWYAVYPATNEHIYPYLYYQAYSEEKAQYGYTGFDHTFSAGNLQMFLPSTQFATSDASELRALSAGVVGNNEDKTLSMKNVGGLIKISLPSQNITSVTLYGNSGEMIAGRVTAAFSEDGSPIVSEVTGSNTIHLIPSTKETPFAGGIYYINVAPVVFENGLTLLFTDSDSKYAVVRTANRFEVRRSQISELPPFNLTFGGKFIEWNFMEDHAKYKGITHALQRYDETTGNKINLPSSATSSFSGEQIVTDGTYDVTVNATRIFTNGGNNGGFCFGKTVGNYLSLPKIDNYALSKVAVRSGLFEYLTAAGLCLVTKPDAEGVYANVPNCNPWPGNVQGGMEYIWSLDGKSDETYALMITTTASNEYCRLQTIRLYYADAPEGVSTVNPLITDVSSSEPTINYPDQKVTLKASFSAVDYSALSQFSCGFQYKLKSAADWTSVTCTTAMDFSTEELTLAEAGEYEYRPWVKIEKTGKTVYGDAGSFDSSTIVLSLVFDDSYWDRTPEGENANFLVREWGWLTNQNNSSLHKPSLGEMNGKSYDFVYNGCAYPFTFYSLQGTYYDTVDAETGETVSTLSPGGYTLRVASGSQKTYGLCMNYINSNRNLEAYPAWIQLPGVQNFKLKEVGANTCSENGFSIATDVVTDENASETEKGTAKDGCVIGESLSKWAHSIILENANPGQRYYLCTVQNRVTFENMTLTYEYAGE